MCSVADEMWDVSLFDARIWPAASASATASTSEAGERVLPHVHEPKDPPRAELAVFRLLLGLVTFLRRYALVPSLVIVVPLFPMKDSATALDIALNACAALFVLEADDILAAGPWFSERLRADVEKHSVVRLTRRQEARLRLSTYAHITAVAMAVLVPMVISWADALVEADDTVALTGSTGITHPRIFIADLAYFLIWCASLIETLLTTPGARRKLVGVLRLLLLWLLAMVVRYVLATGVLEWELKESEGVAVGSYFVPFGPSQGKRVLAFDLAPWPLRDAHDFYT